jgi:hypothetical protein
MPRQVVEAVWSTGLGLAAIPTMGVPRPQPTPYFHAQALTAQRQRKGRRCSVTLGLKVGMLPPDSRSEVKEAQTQFKAWSRAEQEMASLRGMFLKQLQVCFE